VNIPDKTKPPEPIFRGLYINYCRLLDDSTSCRINIAPARSKGAIMINEAGLPENDLKKIPSAINAMINSAPPITSYFQAITRMMINPKTGMLCIRNPRICLPGGTSPPNESKENNNKNSIERIARIRGNQYRILRVIIACF